MLQGDISNGILNKDFASVLSFLLSLIRCISAGLFLNAIILSPGEHFIAKFSFGYFITPVFEGTFSELHDVALVHQCHALAFMFDSIFYSSTNQTLRALFRYRLNADS
ncbi:hypothetical protein D3C78_1221100 [compost metagenome]